MAGFEAERGTGRGFGFLFAFGSFVIALLAFLDRDKDHKLKK